MEVFCFLQASKSSLSLHRSPAVLQRFRQLSKSAQHVREHGHLSSNASLLPLLKVQHKSEKEKEFTPCSLLWWLDFMSRRFPTPSPFLFNVKFLPSPLEWPDWGAVQWREDTGEGMRGKKVGRKCYQSRQKNKTTCRAAATCELGRNRYISELCFCFSLTQSPERKSTQSAFDKNLTSADTGCKRRCSKITFYLTTQN